MPLGTEERFWQRVDKAGDCWLWTWGKSSTGYGLLRVDGKPQSVHRLSWKIHFGEIPEGMFVLHSCDVRACVRPDHLRLGSASENALDTHGRGRWRYVRPGHGRRPPAILGRPGPKPSPPSERFWPKVDKRAPDDCWFWRGGIDAQGYGKFFDPSRKSRAKAHRISYEINVGPIPEGMDILHSCDNRACVNPAHLRPGTDRDNVADRVKRNRNGNHAGEANGNVKLSDEQVAEIRARYSGAWGEQSALAREFGVGQPQIWRIVTGRQR